MATCLQPSVHLLSEVSTLSPPATRQRAARMAKRAMDIAGATLGLLLLSPILAWTALAVLATQGRPILFRQERPGLGGKPFTIMKFRTMRAPRPGEVYYLTDDQRITRLGRFLRSTSLDEIPELWNVVRGDMSLVGPRPLLMEYLNEYSPIERRRHAVRPGITGWAVVNGRNTLHLRRSPQAGRLVRGQLEPVAGCADSGDDSRAGRSPSGCLGHGGHFAGVPIPKRGP